MIKCGSADAMKRGRTTPPLESDLLDQAASHRRRALDIIQTLGLFERWARVGRPVLVGAVRTGLMVAFDIDMEIYADDPQIADGFAVLSEIALLPGVRKIRYTNNRHDESDPGLYWQIRYCDERGDDWKVDSWLLSENHPHAHWAEGFADAMERALTQNSRHKILQIKEAMVGEAEVRGIDIYRAVLEGGVQTPAEFQRWHQRHQTPGMVLWKPV